MNPDLRRDFQALVHLLRPHVVAEAILLYALGGAIARYLGQPPPPGLYAQGQLIVLALVLAGVSLETFFTQAHGTIEVERNEPLLVGGEASRIRLRLGLYFGFASLSLAATLASILVASRGLALAAGLILLLGVVAAVAYAAPPFRLAHTGYGELLSTLGLAAGIPSFSYALLTGGFHRLLLMSTAPLVAVTFASQLALELPGYGADLRDRTRNLMVQLGWQTGMRVHDVALLSGYLLLAFALALGLPQRVGLGSLLTLPLAVAQVWYLIRLRDGAPPRWWLLRGSSYALVGLLTYLQLSGYLLS